MIEPASDDGDFSFLSLRSICGFESGGRTTPESTRLTTIQTPSGLDINGNLSVVFASETTSPIKNQFNVVQPLCFAFIVNALQANQNEANNLLYTENGGLITFFANTSVQFSLHGNDVTFALPDIPDIRSGVGRGGHRRLQICIDGSEAVFFSECVELDRQPFFVLNPQPATYVSVLVDAFQGDPIFNVSWLYNRRSMAKCIT